MTCVTGTFPDGNVLTDTVHTYTYDPNWGSVLSVDTVGLTYDALGRMVEQNRSGTYTQIVYAPTKQKLALMFGQTLSQALIPLPAGAQAVYNSSGLHYYRHRDWLGSSRFASTPTRTLYADEAYAPFGENYAATGSTDLHFTGHDADITNGLYDTWFREYHPKQGRWISPDPAGLVAADPTDPQSWNRYAYVMNSPLGSTDALGLAEKDVGVPVCRFTLGCEAVVHVYGGNGGVYGAAVAGTIGWVPTRYIPEVDNNQDGRVVGWTPDPLSGSWVSQSIGSGGSGPGAPGSSGSGSSATGSSAANNGSWLQQGLNYLKNHPVFISVNEIVAAQITVQWSTKTVCANLGAGASVPPTKAVTVGVYNNGNMSNWTNVLSSWGYSFGANLIAGYQASTNSSGTIGGPTISGVGLSGSYTYGGCTSIP